MEQETDFFHLFTQHQLIVFGVASLLIMAGVVSVGFLLGRRAERQSKGAKNETRR